MEREKALLLALLVSKKRKLNKKQEFYMKIRTHRIWVRKILLERRWKGEYHTLIKELILFDHELFYKQFRMSPGRFEELLRLVGPSITKSSLKERPFPQKSAFVSL